MQRREENDNFTGLFQRPQYIAGLAADLSEAQPSHHDHGHSNQQSRLNSGPVTQSGKEHQSHYHTDGDTSDRRSAGAL